MLASAYHELEDMGGGRFRHTQHMRPIAYRNAGNLARIASSWQNGDTNWTHVVTAAPMLVYTAADGMRRICPTRDPARYFEIGAPYIKPANQWQKVNLGTATRSGNRLTWSTAQADVVVTMAGHFIKLEIPLKGGWQPPNGQFAFPVGLTGLTRSGPNILADGVPVMRLQAPVVYDAGNRGDTREIAYQFTRLSGQDYVLFTLPDLTGMVSPVIDPTLTLQPDATAGMDTYIFQAQSTWNFGAGADMPVGLVSSSKCRGLLKCDLSSVPADLTITAATLALYCSTEESTTDKSVSVHRALVQWYEGVKSGSAPDAGQDGSTWGKRNYNGSISWGAAGGASGTDYTATATATTSITGSGLAFTWDVLADVQAWYGGTANYGWFLINVGESAVSGKHFVTSDGATEANRPKLVIEYGAGGNPYYAFAQQ